MCNGSRVLHIEPKCRIKIDLNSFASIDTLQSHVGNRPQRAKQQWLGRIGVPDARVVSFTVASR